MPGARFVVVGGANGSFRALGLLGRVGVVVTHVVYRMTIDGGF